MPESQLLAMLRRAEDELRQLRRDLSVATQQLGQAEQQLAGTRTASAN
jgi:hypothetical protein